MGKRRGNPKLWGGRFSEGTDAAVEAFTASVQVDARLWPHDIRGSIAHARMLGRQRILPVAESRKIIAGLRAIARDIDAGRFDWDPALEDVHMNIEAALIRRVGAAGKKLHTGRSRNDQVATDLRLYVRDAIDGLVAALERACAALRRTARREAATLFPGLTHLQIAQPVTVGHHLMAWHAMLERDRARLLDARRRVNVLPLGSAALAGTGFPIDRAAVAAELGFEGVSDNSMDAVSDRDFAIEFASACALTMVHLSRIGEELVLWSSPLLGWVTLPDRYCTGSSIMPQKKNPDVPELVRGKAGRVVGGLQALLVLMKSQPLAYNRDNQEDKPALFDVHDTTLACVEMIAGLAGVLKFDRAACAAAAAAGHSTATDLADHLVRQGVPFRDAHRIVGEGVAEATRRGLRLDQLPLADLRRLSPRIGADVKKLLTVAGSAASRRHLGGTAPATVRAAIARAERRLKKAGPRRR